MVSGRDLGVALPSLNDPDTDRREAGGSCLHSVGSLATAQLAPGPRALHGHIRCEIRHPSEVRTLPWRAAHCHTPRQSSESLSLFWVQNHQ